MTGESNSTATPQSAATVVEDIIAGLVADPAAAPICWILCSGDRLLQIPWGPGMPANVYVFTRAAAASAFLSDPRRHLHPEQVRSVPVDSVATLLRLLTATSRAAGYVAPPFDVRLNESMRGMVSSPEKDLTVHEQPMDEARLARWLGVPVRRDEARPADDSHCPVCGEELWMGAPVVGFGDSGLEALLRPRAEAQLHTAYACRQCGAPICMSCAQKVACPKCGNNTFDRFDLARRPAMGTT